MLSLQWSSFAGWLAEEFRGCRVDTRSVQIYHNGRLTAEIFLFMVIENVGEIINFSYL